MKRLTNIAAILIVMIIMTSVLPVEMRAKSPKEIMEMVDEQRSPDSARSRMTMRIYRTLNAKEHDREIRIVSYARGTTDSHMEFVTPRSIRGLRVLDLDGTIRVFFPSTGRVRNIGSGDRGGSVGGVGGDFTYEDMGGSGFMSDYRNFEVIEENTQLWKISGIPLDEDSQYSKLTFHIDKELYIPVQIDYYDNKTKSKQLMASDIQVIDNRNVATHLIMKNIKNNSRTEIRLADLEWDVSLPDELFHPNRFYR